MTQPSRRGFLKFAGALPAAASGAAIAAAPTASRAGDDLLRTHFSPLLGSQFSAQIDSDAQANALRLVAIEDLPFCADAQRSFRLVFQSAASPEPMRQNTWQLSHPLLGSHAIFLSPNDAASTEIEAIFNRG